MINNSTFIEAMNAAFRAVDSSVVVDGTKFGADNILNLNPYFTGSLLTAIMRCCSIEIQYDEEIDATTATALRGKTVDNIRIGAKSKMLSDKLFSQFNHIEKSLYLQEAQQFNVAIKISVNDEYLLTIKDESENYLATDVLSYTVPANTKFYVVLKRADGEDIELTEAANIVFDMDYSYIEFGSYSIYSADFNEESNSVTLTCYDKMLDAAVPYDIEISNDTTVKEYLKAICNRLGWTLADVPFTNENAVITAGDANSYLSITDSVNNNSEDNYETDDIQTETVQSSYTFRDVLEDIAECIGGGLIFKADGLLYPVYPTLAECDGEILKLSIDNQESITFGDQYGIINGVAIIDKSTADAAVLSDSESITANGECRINIVDNPLLNANRPAFINGIFSRLNGLYYVAYDFNSYGFGYLEYGDMFNIEDKKGNLKRGILLSDSVKFGLTVSETASAQAYSADSDTDYSIATPFDKLKVEVKRLSTTSTLLSERIQEAAKAIGLTTDGHAVLVDLEYDDATDKYYIGNGVADTFIASENPAVATADEPNDWNTGRIVRINYNGFAVSTTGISGPYIDFAVYYDETLNKFLINADDIAVGTLQGIKAILDEGIIGGFTIGTWKDDNDNDHEGLKKTFNIDGNYITFAIDGTDGSENSHYLLQMFYSDEDGNAIPGEYLFALSIGSNMELDTLNVRTINYKDDTGWMPISYSENFEDYSAFQKLKYRKVGNMVEIRGACKPTATIPGSTTEYVIGNIGKGPVEQFETLCQGSVTAVWMLTVKTNGNLTFSRYRQGGTTYVDATSSVWLPIHETFFLD